MLVASAATAMGTSVPTFGWPLAIPLALHTLLTVAAVVLAWPHRQRSIQARWTLGIAGVAGVVTAIHFFLT